MGNSVGFPQGGQYAPGASGTLSTVSAILGGIARGKAIRQMKADKQLQEQYQFAVQQYQMISQQWQTAAQNLQSAMASGNQAAIKAAQQIFNDLESQRMNSENQVKQIAAQITEYDGPGVSQAPKAKKSTTTKKGEVAAGFEQAARGAYSALTSILNPGAAPQQMFKPIGSPAAPQTATSQALSSGNLNPYPSVAHASPSSPAAPNAPSAWQPGSFSVVR